MLVTIDPNHKALKSPITNPQTGVWGYTVDLSLIENGSRTITHFVTYNGWPIRIDWGDGIVEDYGIWTVSSDSPTHTYAEGQDIFHIRVYSLSGIYSNSEGGIGMYCPFGYATPAATKQAVVCVFSTDVALRNYHSRRIFDGFKNLEYCDYSMLRNRVLADPGTWGMFNGTKISYAPEELYEHQMESKDYTRVFSNSLLKHPPPYPRLCNQFILRILQYPYSLSP